MLAQRLEACIYHFMQLEHGRCSQHYHVDIILVSFFTNIYSIFSCFDSPALACNTFSPTLAVGRLLARLVNNAEDV
jgi:hypothetical protein